LNDEIQLFSHFGIFLMKLNINLDSVFQIHNLLGSPRL
jgi:hypothetical protein